MRSTVGPVEGAIDALNEGLSVERLREKADGPARERPLLDSRIRKSGNKDDRRSTMCGRQLALQLETADARHLNIRNDAGRFSEFRRLQKRFSRRKTPGSESERPNEVCRRDANGFLVIDNCNESFFCHCWLVLEHWWCLHKTAYSTRPELPQSKALADQAIGASHPTGGCGPIGVAGLRRGWQYKAFFVNGLATLRPSTAQSIRLACNQAGLQSEVLVRTYRLRADPHARLNTRQNRSSVVAFLHQRHRGGRKVDADGCFDLRS